MKQAGKKLMEDGEIIQFREKDASDHFSTYFIDQNVVEDAGNENYACSCADFQLNAICKHIYATHLKMEKEKQKAAKQDFKIEFSRKNQIHFFPFFNKIWRNSSK